MSPDVRETNNKYVIKETRGVQPSFILHLQRPAAVNARMKPVNSQNNSNNN